MTTPGEERVVLLDDDGVAIGTAPKRDVHHRATPLHLAFSCYVFDHDGRFLLTRRALHKRTWPGMWTNSCCGHPAPGELVAHAVSRRVRQELGTDLTDVRLLLADFRYRAVMGNGTVENEVCPVYVATCPDPRALDADPDEVATFAWVDWSTFRAEVVAGRRGVTPWCVEQIAALPEDPR